MSERAASLIVRTAGHVDIPAVLAIWEQARSPAAVTRDDDAAIEWLLERDPEALLIAELGDTAVGALVAGWDGWRGNMYRLAVLEAHRRRGVARMLVDEAHRRLAARGARRVTALVAPGEDEAIGLWEAMGYARDGMARHVRNL
jgi:ribosomal protein S18 acetylase RimI-like enzyme